MTDTKSAADQSRAMLRSTLKLLRIDLHTGLGAFTEQVCQMQRRYAATGFAGIARNLEQVKTPAQGTHGRATQTASIIDQVLATLATITDEATPQEATTALTRAVAGIDRAHQNTMAIGQGLAQLQQLVAARLQGGNPQELLQRAAAMRQLCTQAAQQLAAAKTHAGTAIGDAMGN